MAVRFSNTTSQTYTSTSSVPTGALTVTFWVQLVSNIATYQPFWVVDNNTSNAADLLVCTSSDGVGLRVYGVTEQLDGPDMVVGTWYQIAVTKSSARSVVLYYAALGSALTASTPTTYSAITPTTMRIGGFQSGVATNSPDARIANVKQWSTDLTQAEVETELAQAVPVRLANLVRWHPFTAAGTTDYTGAGLTLSGGTGVTTEDGPPVPWTDLASILTAPTGGVSGDVSAATTAASTVAASRADAGSVSRQTAASSTATANAASNLAVTHATTAAGTVSASTGGSSVNPGRFLLLAAAA